MKKILHKIEPFFSKSIKKHGATAAGVDWNSQAGQILRFQQLMQVVAVNETAFSLNDLGCGYAALYRYLRDTAFEVDYCGIDISDAMIEAARDFAPEIAECFICSDKMPRLADYSVASGIFNLRFNISDADWLNYILETLNHLYAMSVKGFSFNCLTYYSDPDRTRPNLYYADPLMLFDYCKRHFSKYVTLLHDYGLYEFTIVVRNAPVTMLKLV